LIENLAGWGDTVGEPHDGHAGLIVYLSHFRQT
jgi:hypothetical protein